MELEYVTVRPVSGDKLILGEQFEIIIDFGNEQFGGDMRYAAIALREGLDDDYQFVSIYNDWTLVSIDNGIQTDRVEDGTGQPIKDRNGNYVAGIELGNNGSCIKITATTSLDLCYKCINTDSYAPAIDLMVITNFVDDVFYEENGGFDHYSNTHAFYVPDSVVPTFSFTIDDWNSMYANYGVYPRTKTTITGTATGAYGAYIKSIEWCNGTGANYKILNSTILEANSEYLTSRINVNDAVGGLLWAIVTDSRGRRKQFNVTIINSELFVDYTEPTVTITDVYRCDENGDASEEGAYGAVIFNAACGHDVSAALANANYSVWYRKANTNDSWVYIIKRDLDGNKSVDSYKAIIALDPNFKYQVAIGVYDGIIPRKVSNPVNILAITAFIEFDKVNNSIGLGGLASGTDTLTIALKTKFLNGTDLMIPATASLQASAWTVTNGIYTSKLTIDRSIITSIPTNASVLISPTPDSYESYCDSGIRVTKIDIPRTLTFICDSVPSENINVNILILKC